jgi:Arc/MetJ-type ribon-helix-helix transcriptional regulator
MELRCLTTFQLPVSVDKALEAAAKAQYTSKSEYIRRAILASLKADGVKPESVAADRRSHPPDAAGTSAAPLLWTGVSSDRKKR